MSKVKHGVNGFVQIFQMAVGDWSDLFASLLRAITLFKLIKRENDKD